MGSLILLLSLAVSIAASSSSSSESVLQMIPHDSDSRHPGGVEDLYCDSWRLSVETNNAGYWRVIPERCLEFVEAYMSSDRYWFDSEVIADESISFAKSVSIADDGKDAWIFDIDETLLSNLPYYTDNGYGSLIFNETAFNEWVDSMKAPALASSLRLYKELQGLGFQLVLLTGRVEAQRNVTEENLLFSGYHSWERLILRESTDVGKPAVVYKSKKRAELESQGFRIHGNSGDQWSDLQGCPVARRSFKLPNPMYYIL